jgi:hypothetical protein
MKLIQERFSDNLADAEAAIRMPPINYRKSSINERWPSLNNG